MLNQLLESICISSYEKDGVTVRAIDKNRAIALGLLFVGGMYGVNKIKVLGKLAKTLRLPNA